MTLLLASTALAGPADEAQSRLDALGPHVATYVKESTGKTVLTTHYHAPTEAVLVAQNEDGIYRFSVDPVHIRIAVDEVCASIAYGELHEAARKVSLGLDTEPAQPRLNYRTTAAGGVEFGAAFAVSETPVLFSWHADLEAEGSVVDKSGKAWRVALGEEARWTLDAKSGLLQRMAVGDDALVLKGMVRGKDAAPIAARSVCPVTTSPELEHSMTALFRTPSILGPYTTLVVSWEDLPPAKRAEAIRAMKAWWADVVAADLGPWSQQWMTTQREALMSQVADASAFAAFRAGQPSASSGEAVSAWKALWYQEAAQALLRQYASEVVEGLLAEILRFESFDDKALRDPLLLGPFQTALLADPEPAFRERLNQIIDEASKGLERPPAP